LLLGARPPLSSPAHPPEPTAANPPHAAAAVASWTDRQTDGRMDAVPLHIDHAAYYVIIIIIIIIITSNKSVHLYSP